MGLNRLRCQNWKLYVIADREAMRGNSAKAVVRAALAGGASVIQLRDKKGTEEEIALAGRELLPFTRAANVPLIINDWISVAKAIGADGVHLGQDDASLAEARRALGANALVGRSTHSPEQALKAQEEGFDYIGVGPVFKTPTKAAYAPVGLELISFAAKNIYIPFVAIGGIDESNIHRVTKAGAKIIAVVRAVAGAEWPEEAVKNLLRAFP